jgi:ParB family chromosome partitioning protein
MTVHDIPLDRITPAPWNANRLDELMRARLAASIGRYGLVQPLLVRRVGDDFETVAGAQRLGALRERGEPTAPCVVLDDLSDADARVLSVALNRIGGSDDINALGALAREVLAVLPAEAVSAIVPVALGELRGLAELPKIAAGDGPALANALKEAGRAWERAKEVAFERVAFAFTAEQRETVERAVTEALRRVVGDDPNKRGAALALIAGEWLAARRKRLHRAV